MSDLLLTQTVAILKHLLDLLSAIAIILRLLLLGEWLARSAELVGLYWPIALV
jgi:hypothetical protein